MKGADLVLLVFGGLAVAQDGAKLASSMVETVKDPIQGGFMTFMTFTLDNQPIKALLDTGSSDLTVQRSGSEICKNPVQQCDGGSKTGQVFGAFDAQKAKNSKGLGVPLDAVFTGGAAFQGEFAEVPFRLGDGNAIDLQTGLIETGNPPPQSVLFPVLGIGPVEGESTFRNNGSTYSNLLVRLKEEGQIQRNAFGLYLGHFQSPDNGSIVWGGFDAAKFDGELQTVDMEPDLDGNMASFVVSLSSVRMTNIKDGSGASRSNQKEPLPRRRSGPVRRLSPRHNYKRASEPLSLSQDELQTRHNYKRASEPLSEDELQKRQLNGNLLRKRKQVVLVDTGDQSLVLPLNVVEFIAETLEGGPDQKTGWMRVNCDLIQGMALTVGMGNDAAKINILLELMVLGPDFDKDLPEFLNQGRTGRSGGGPGPRGDDADQDSRGGNTIDGPQGRDGGNGSRAPGGCLLPILPIEDGSSLSIFGAPAMQSMYVVFDADSQVLMFGQARLNETRTDPRELGPVS